METQKLSILIPAFNEESTISSVLDSVRETVLPHGMEKEIIVVDDCSIDTTKSVIENYILKHPHASIMYRRHDMNRGKGAAIHTGVRVATGNYVIIQDADLEYNPKEYSVLLQPVLDGFADVVYGSRFMGGGPHRVLFFWHTIGNKFLTFLCKLCTNLNLTDMETGYKLFRTEVIQKLDLHEERFGFEPEVTAKVARYPGVRIYEVGISYYGRTYAEGKKIGWRDGFRAIWCILKYALNRNHTFI